MTKLHVCLSSRKISGLVLPYLCAKSIHFERCIKKMTEKFYFAAKARLIITFNSVIIPWGKYLVPNE